MKTQVEGNYIVAFPEDRINSDNARQIEQELNAVLEQNPGKELAIDAQDLDYVSSAGLRVLLKFSTGAGKPLVLRNAGPELYEILDMTGFTELFDVSKKMKSISVEGCEVIGHGAYGTVYKTDEDTIVKVYESADSLPLIEVERKKAKQAFIKGIPTAISYDIVRVGDSYGSVFELLHADNMNDVLLANLDKMDELLVKYVQLIKSVHNVEAALGELPSDRDNFLQYLVELKDIIPEDIAAAIRNMLLEMPEDKHIIHGDIQMKNVMFADDEPMLIDMESLCIGDPVFDLQSLFVCYKAYNEDEPDNCLNFLGLKKEICDRIWELIVKNYFEGYSEEQIKAEEDKIYLLGYVGFLNSAITNGFSKPELRDIRIKHSIEHIRDLLPRVKSFVLTRREDSV